MTTTLTGVSRKRVLITVNPGLMGGEDFYTINALVAALDENCELTIATVGDYDFDSRKVRGWRRIAEGKFEDLGMLVPHADLWIVYSDGYWLDARTLGFKSRMDFYKAQIDLHYYHLACGNVGMIVNSLASEQTTLKSWLAAPEISDASIIPTYCPHNFDELRDLKKEKGIVVAKPVWGGAMLGISRLATDADMDSFQAALNVDHPYTTMESYCFQDYAPDPVEKRFYIAGGKCVGARHLTGRLVPWGTDDNERGCLYDERIDDHSRDRAAVDRLLKLSDLTMGSIDFVGPRINEINGGGTVFTYRENNAMVLDFRQPLVDSFLQILTRL